jgi:hypothetical protein
MARRSAQSALKRAREQAMREKRERKQAKKDARAAERLNPTEPDEDSLEEGEGEGEEEAELDDAPAVASGGDSVDA